GLFTTYGIKIDNDAYKFDFYGKTEEEETEEGLVIDLSSLKEGSKVVIVNKAYKKALSQNYNGYYNSGVDVTIEDDKVVNPSVDLIWTIGFDSDGNYQFKTADGKKLALGASYSSMPLDEVHDAWKVTPVSEEADNDVFFIENVGRPGQVMEWYDSKNNWSCYGSNTTGELFQQQFYLVKEKTEPQPEGDTYGLTSTLATGDKVILYNSKNGMGLGNTLTGTRISAVSLTPVDGVITTSNTDVVWEVTVNADGTYAFKQDGKILGGVVNGNKNDLVVTNPEADSWTLEGPDEGDFNYFMYLGDLASSFGKVYLEYYNGFTLYGSNNPNKDSYGITFYKQGADPETPVQEVGDLVTDLSQLTDGATVAIYSPGHQTAISTIPNGDWYLRANTATIENGKVQNFTEDFIWKVRVNDDGTYSFIAYDDETHTICVWPSGSYAEVTVLFEKHPDADDKWNLAPAKTANCYYISSLSITGTNSRGVTGPAYLEAYVRNESEVFSGFFNTVDKLTEGDFALQFYLVDPEDAIPAYDDGEWDGVMEKGETYVMYNAIAEASTGLFKEASYALTAVPTTIENDKARAGNGAYAFKVDTMGRYYSFEVNGKYLATNEAEELFFVDPDEEGKAPENAKWYLKPKNDGYIIYNKKITYNGTPVCIEYYSSVFSGWTFSTKNDVNIYLFNFYKPADDLKICENVVQDPSVIFDCASTRYIEEDYSASFTLDDLAESIESIDIYYVVNERRVTVDDYEVSSDGKAYSFDLTADEIDGNEKPKRMYIHVEVSNSYGISYEGILEVWIFDEPFFTDPKPAPNEQTKEEKRPEISVKAGNIGENPQFRMFVNDVEVDAVYENGRLSYTPAEDLPDGRVTVRVTVKRADNMDAEKVWSFIVGLSEYQLYFGQLHSHTTYSDGSGTLETALEYISSIPKSANVQFVAFTDHSNYFDTTSAANPADAMNDKSLMTPASRALWEKYKGTIADFNASHDDIIAIGGYEMTWSGGPGHINSFNTDGLVSRNNEALNNKANDAGLQLYYATMNKDTEYETMHMFNHPGTTFGNFNDFAYWDEETDKHMFLVEVGNGEGQIGEGGYYPSYEEYILALDKGWHVAPTNDQDNHKGRWGNANDARNVVLTNDFSEEGIYEAIKSLRLYATEDKNLQLTYQINGEPMGTVFTDENTPDKLDVQITMYDPDDTDMIIKVEIVTNGGVTVWTWGDQADIKEGVLTAEMVPEYSYYFVRVTQSDGDIAVTAPIWVGNALDLGIESFTCADDKVYTGKESTLTAQFYNNENTKAVIKSLTYLVNGSEVIGTDTTAKEIPANGTLSVDFSHVFTKAKITTVTVSAVIEIDGKEYVYSAKVELDVIDKENENTVSTIKEVRDASIESDTGYRFIIEGVVTSNASGHDKDTAFFDCIYVQDETGGICCFPVSGDFKIGDKVHIVGHTDFYQGEPELQVQETKVIGQGEVSPEEIKATQLNDRSAEGRLVTIKGTVESFEEANGLIQTVMVKDDKGNVARVFIDGYITTAYDVERLFVGNGIEATGLASYDNTWPDTGAFPRIRIRDRKDVVCDDYKIIEGKDSTWVKDSEEDLLIVSNAPNEKFDGLYIDGQRVGEDVYTRESGSTRITLPASYLQTLTDGNHVVKIKSTDGSASTNLLVKGVTEPGDPDNPDNPDIPVNPDQPDNPDKPDPVKPVVPFVHPLTGVDSMSHYRPHIGNVRKY
ncbi:MAG: hypothetical protein IJL85_02180, partial [Erysipelotrichaceae bacterium]|nr:hypothetical protein [Erysipelotrichaceae bacterium]